MNAYAGPRLNQEMVKAQALPGRRFSKSADRKGWLYINTWYMIDRGKVLGERTFRLSIRLRYLWTLMRYILTDK